MAPNLHLELPNDVPTGPVTLRRSSCSPTCYNLRFITLPQAQRISPSSHLLFPVCAKAAAGPFETRSTSVVAFGGVSSAMCQKETVTFLQH
jgi:hypothetical protein